MNMRANLAQEAKVVLRDCVVPQYEGMDDLEEIAQRMVDAHRDHVDAVLMDTRDMHKTASRGDGGIHLSSVRLYVLTNYPEGEYHGREFQDIASKHPTQHMEVDVVSLPTERYLEGIGTEILCVSPAVVVYKSERFQTR